MKLGLVTIHNVSNYGAVLQAFALQEVLSRKGSVEIINYDNRHVSRSLDLIRLKPSFHGALGAGKDFFRLFPRKRAITKFKSFIKSNFKQTVTFTREQLERGGAPTYDYYVAGSDQIWNPDCISSIGEFDPIYFLTFAPREAQKISFSSSMGAYKINPKDENILKDYLSSFKHISVREAGTQKVLTELLNRKVDHVLDPSLLLSGEEWIQKFNIQRNSEEKYILLYTIPKMSQIREAVEYVSRKLNLKVIALDQNLSAGAKVDKHIRDAGPLEFLHLFANAEFVVTDSFHGVCFSLNFQKPFIAVAPGKNVNRMESLLSKVGLENRIIKNQEVLERTSLNVDFQGPGEALAQLRKESLDVLFSYIQ